VLQNHTQAELATLYLLERLPLILTAIRAGLREGELAGLAWGDIQFGESDDDPDRYMLVQRNYDRRWSRTMLTPKNRKARRVDMSRGLRRVLLQLRDERLVTAFAEGKPDISEELVFPSDAGTPIEMNNFTARVFKPVLIKAGLQKIRFHDLRHTFGSLLIQTGASLAYVRDQMVKRHHSGAVGKVLGKDLGNTFSVALKP
jgi:integrase